MFRGLMLATLLAVGTAYAGDSLQDKIVPVAYTNGTDTYPVVAKRGSEYFQVFIAKGDKPYFSDVKHSYFLSDRNQHDGVFYFTGEKMVELPSAEEVAKVGQERKVRLASQMTDKAAAPVKTELVKAARTIKKVNFGGPGMYPGGFYGAYPCQPFGPGAYGPVGNPYYFPATYYGFGRPPQFARPVPPPFPRGPFYRPPPLPYPYYAGINPPGPVGGPGFGNPPGPIGGPGFGGIGINPPGPVGGPGFGGPGYGNPPGPAGGPGFGGPGVNPLGPAGGPGFGGMGMGDAFLIGPEFMY